MYIHNCIHIQWAARNTPVKGLPTKNYDLKWLCMLQAKVADANAPNLKQASLGFLVVPKYFYMSSLMLWIVLWLSIAVCTTSDNTLAACSVALWKYGISINRPHFGRPGRLNYRDTHVFLWLFHPEFMSAFIVHIVRPKSSTLAMFAQLYLCVACSDVIFRCHNFWVSSIRVHCPRNATVVLHILSSASFSKWG